jgi:hypothetical protein
MALINHFDYYIDSNRFCQALKAGGIDPSESIPGLLKGTVRYRRTRLDWPGSGIVG